MNKWFLIIAFSLPLAIFSPGSAEAKNKVRIGGNVVVEEGTEVKDAVAVGGSVTVNGKVRDSAVAVGSSLILVPIYSNPIMFAKDLCHSQIEYFRNAIDLN